MAAVTPFRRQGIDFCYERRGSGPRLLFLNGSGGTLTTAAPLLDHLAQRFDVLAHDQRGMGRTSLPSSPYRLADLAEDAAALADHVGWESYRVLGISFGGMVAQELAVAFPQIVERLALLCTSAGGEGGSSFPLQNLFHLPREEWADRYGRLLDTRFPHELPADSPDRATLEMIISGAGAPRSSREQEGSALQMAARAAHDVFERLPALRIPVLVAAGRYDGIAPYTNSAAIADQIPGADLRVFEGGHFFFLQDPQALPAIMGFLSEA
jgi:pimeloyl-ACP methyl ester carboxylesterase